MECDNCGNETEDEVCEICGTFLWDGVGLHIWGNIWGF